MLLKVTLLGRNSALALFGQHLHFELSILLNPSYVSDGTIFIPAPLGDIIAFCGMRLVSLGRSPSFFAIGCSLKTSPDWSLSSFMSIGNSISGHTPRIV